MPERMEERVQKQVPEQQMQEQQIQEQTQKQVPEQQAQEKPTGEKNKMAVASLLLVLAGPTLLFLTGLVSGLSDNYFSETFVTVLQVFLFVLPIKGIVLSILCITLWKKKISAKMHAMPIVALILCNPMFAYFYYVICIIITATAAGMGWM